MLDLKKLIFYNKLPNKKILIVGKGPFADFISLLFKKLGLNFKYIKLNNKSNLKTINFFEEIYIPEQLFLELGFFEKNFSDIKFCLCFNELIFPVINYFQFFQECCKQILNINIKLEFDNIKDKLLDMIFAGILHGYGYPVFSSLKQNYLNILENHFFSKNIVFKNGQFSKSLNSLVKSSNIDLIYYDSVNSLVRKRKKFVIDNNKFEYDIFFTDILSLIKPKKIIKVEKNIIEFKIDKDYTTEYFPKKIIFCGKSFNKMELVENSFQRKFQVSSFDNIEFPEIYFFLKNYFPDLKENDIIVEKNSKIIYENFKFKDELQPFNFISKVIEIKNFFENNM